MFQGFTLSYTLAKHTHTHTLISFINGFTFNPCTIEYIHKFQSEAISIALAKEELTMLYLDGELPVFTDGLSRHSASIVHIDELKAIADAKDGQAKIKDGRVVARSIVIIDTVGTTRNDDCTVKMNGGGRGEWNGGRGLKMMQ